MKNFSEEQIIEYMKKRHGYATDNDFHTHFIPQEADAYFKLHMEIDSLLRKGILIPTTSGYELKKD